MLINDETLGIDKNAYDAVASEKMCRGKLKSAVERAVNAHTVVIVDALNYIKGFRYELFCIIRAAASTHCVIHINAPHDAAREWNARRANAYSTRTLDDVWSRFETPDERNRWDRPLLVADEMDTGVLKGTQPMSALLARAPRPEYSLQKDRTFVDRENDFDGMDVDLATIAAPAAEDAPTPPAVKKSIFTRAGAPSAFTPTAAASAPAAATVSMLTPAAPAPAVSTAPSMSTTTVAAIVSPTAVAGGDVDADDDTPRSTDAHGIIDTSRIPAAAREVFTQSFALMPDGAPIHLPVFTDVTAALFARAAYKPPQSVAASLTTGMGYPQALDACTRAVVDAVTTAVMMHGAPIGSSIPISLPGRAPLALVLARMTNMAELKKFKRDFEHLATADPLAVDELPRAFVAYMAAALRASE